MFLEGPSDPEKDTTHRFYACEKVDSTKYSSYTCQKKTFQEITQLQSHSGKKVVSIKRGCPEWNDRLILSWKFGARVSVPNEE